MEDGYLLSTSGPLHTAHAVQAWSVVNDRWEKLGVSQALGEDITEFRLVGASIYEAELNTLFPCGSRLYMYKSAWVLLEPWLDPVAMVRRPKSRN